MNTRTPRNLALAAGALSGTVLTTLARFANIYTDEGWSFSEAVMSARGQTPYVDYFSHRLPLLPDIYGVWYRVVGESLLAGRMLSVLFSAVGIALLTFVLARRTQAYLPTLLGLAVFANVNVLYALATVNTYALALFLFAASCAVLDAERWPVPARAAVFMLLQSILWTLRYPTDVQGVLVIIFAALTLFALRRAPRAMALVAVAATLPLLWALRTWLFSGDARMWYDTVTFNMNQVPERISRGIITGPMTTWQARVGVMRRLEIVEYYPVLIGALVALIALVPRMLRGLRRWLAVPEEDVAAYSVLFGISYYGFNLVTTYDHPVTKVYLLGAAAIAIGLALKPMGDVQPGTVNRWFAVAVAATLYVWPVAQLARWNAVLRLRNSDIDLLDSVSRELRTVTNGREPVLAVSPILMQGGIQIEPSLSMDVYSLLHSLDDTAAARHHLATPTSIKERLRSRAYAAVVIDERVRSNEGMSTLLAPHRDDLMTALRQGYRLRTTIGAAGQYVAPFEIWVRN
jgi:hypothetical protein